MAAGTVTLYSANKDDINITNIVAGTPKLLLVTSSYTPSSGTSGNSVLADVSSFEISSGNGYTTGGITLTSLASTAISGGWKFSSANPSWTASGGSIPAWRYGILYMSGSLWGMTSPLLGYFLGDTTPADIPATTNGNTLTITVPAGGWFDVT